MRASSMLGAVAGAVGLALAGCGDARPVQTGSGSSFTVCPSNLAATFSSINQNVFQQTCVACHGPGGVGLAEGGLDLKTDPYHALVDVPAQNNNAVPTPGPPAAFPKRVVPGHPEQSFLVKKLSITDQGGPFGSGMPQTSPGSVCPDTLTKIQQWITAGAPND
jgi:cytochrome c5